MLLTIPSNFEMILKEFFRDPAIIIIGASRKGRTVFKIGKTDFFLFCCECAKQLGLAEDIASNIDTQGDYEYISDLQTLKFWLHKNNHHKIYGLDEANIHLPSRRAMSNKSVDIIQIFPEISKARATLFIISHEIKSIDSELRNKGWVKGTMLKHDKKTVEIRSPLLEKPYTFRNVPKTSIHFDPYLQAPFTLKPTDSKLFKDEDLVKLDKWANGTAWKDLFKHPQEANRFIRKEVKMLLSLYSQFTIHSVEGTSKEIGELKE